MRDTMTLVGVEPCPSWQLVICQPGPGFVPVSRAAGAPTEGVMRAVAWNTLTQLGRDRAKRSRDRIDEGLVVAVTPPSEKSERRYHGILQGGHELGSAVRLVGALHGWQAVLVVDDQYAARQRLGWSPLGPGCNVAFEVVEDVFGGLPGGRLDFDEPAVARERHEEVRGGASPHGRIEVLDIEPAIPKTVPTASARGLEVP
jgi:hypothetical protein